MPSPDSERAQSGRSDSDLSETQGLSTSLAANFFSLALQRQHEQVIAMVTHKIGQHNLHHLPPSNQYALTKLKAELQAVLGVLSSDMRVAMLARQQFSADVSVQLPKRITELGVSQYKDTEVQKIADQIRTSQLVSSGKISSVAVVGLYVNLTFGSPFFESVLDQTRLLAEQFGKNTDLFDERVVIDFSSPNTAKRLHAGHIRSTIVGNVLSNLYSACSAIVFKDNHINDWGGFGYILEGWNRWAGSLLRDQDPAERLISVYGVRRLAEKAAQTLDAFNSLAADDLRHMKAAFGEFENYEQFSPLWSQYKYASDERFTKLEAGAQEEVQLWSELVKIALSDFDKFYSKLDVGFDCILGESFYAKRGEEIIQRLVTSGAARKFSSQDYETECCRLDLEVEHENLTAESAQKLKEEAKSDIEAFVIELEPGRRLVALRKDGRTIYSSRDIATIEYRVQTFNPTRVIYVVGQEQQRHFEDVFNAVKRLKMVDSTQVSLTHLSFGFYTEAGTSKKLSSREGAQGVIGLIDGACNHFELKMQERGGELTTNRATARALGIGSVVLNDLKRGIKGAVPIPSNVIELFDEFEKSGGAYIMYSAARAGAVLKKAEERGATYQVSGPDLGESEIILIKKVSVFPSTISFAATTNNPTLLLNYLLELAQAFNSYYQNSPVITDEGVNNTRLAVVKSVQTVLQNGVRLLGVDSPSRI